jgi:hypothetical protein
MNPASSGASSLQKNRSSGFQSAFDLQTLHFDSLLLIHQNLLEFE